MTDTGYATAPGAGTIINAIAMWKGSAFGIDLKTRANVRFTNNNRISGTIKGGGNSFIKAVPLLQHQVISLLHPD